MSPQNSVPDTLTILYPHCISVIAIYTSVKSECRRPTSAVASALASVPRPFFAGEGKNGLGRSRM